MYIYLYIYIYAYIYIYTHTSTNTQPHIHIYIIYIYIYIHIYIYIYYPPPCLQAPRACLRQCQILQAFEEEGGRRSSSLGASTPPDKFLGICCSPFVLPFACTIMFDRSFEPKGAKRAPKWSLEMPKNAKSLEKVGG